MHCLGVQTKCWLCSTTCGFLLRTTRPSGTFAWRKCSKRFLAPFAVRLGSPRFAVSAVIFPLYRSKDTPCSLLLLLSSMVNLYRSLGDPSSYKKFSIYMNKLFLILFTIGSVALLAGSLFSVLPFSITVHLGFVSCAFTVLLIVVCHIQKLSIVICHDIFFFLLI